VWTRLLDGDYVGWNRLARHLSQEGSLECEAVNWPAGAKGRFQPIQAVTDVDRDDAALGVEPVESRLARHVAIRAAHDAVGNAFGQEVASGRVRADACIEFLDELRLVMVKRRPILLLSPFLEFGTVPAVWLSGMRIDRSVDRELGLVALSTAQDAHRGCAMDVAVVGFALREQPLLTLTEEKRIAAEVLQLLRVREVSGFQAVLVLGFLETRG